MARHNPLLSQSGPGLRHDRDPDLRCQGVRGAGVYQGVANGPVLPGGGMDADTALYRDWD